MIRTVVLGLLIALAWVAVAVLVVGMVLPIDDGPLGVLAIFAPHLALLFLALVPVAAFARSRRLWLPLLALALVFGARFGGEWWSFPAASGTPDANGAAAAIDVATWNVEAGVAAGPAVVAMLDLHPVDVVAIEELSPHVARAIETDRGLRSRYPHMALEPTEGVSGIGILSRFPISRPSLQSPPIRLEVTLDLDGSPLVVIAAHPFHAAIETIRGIPVGLSTAERNGDLELLHDRVVELETGGADVIMLGDFNTAPTEPAFPRLTSGLHDAHADVGIGPGWTWRPAILEPLGIGVLRIDLILSTRDVPPRRVEVDCPPIGDHCLVESTLALEP